MPAFAPPALILVTGANGFAATHITSTLLEAGFSVRGTVRSAAKGDALVALYGKNPNFSYTIVPDIADPDAWANGVLDGVDGVAHIAAPIEPEGEVDPQFWLRPAVEGTLNLLRAAKGVSSVKRVVIIGTTASIVDFDLKPVQYTSDDWNDAAIKTLEEQGAKTSAWLTYCASKTLAERAVWDYTKSHPELGYDVTYVLPSWIYGPVLLKVPSPDKLVMSLRLLRGHFAEPKLDDASLSGFSGSWSDARDIAHAFVDAFTRTELGGKRLIQSSPTHPTVQELYDAWDAIPQAERPKLPFDVPRGKPGVDLESRKGFPTFVTSEGEFGWKFRTLSETLKDTFASFAEHGLL
ncbi:NAD(P)-binding protein [Auricularia subglabra TFB-10046 SS5]|uniref:NAD(P)-binding protein n=1 Tax=Auricularia subglabra (strain TFB-10046 / SS5) TaxID=717982 RepID=J0CZZ4_AURST|nr:NAD(P)-binding protein [Auricularia subglabra TFB-10046 SS5]